MSNEIFFKLRTTMEANDNRNFMYIRTFKQNSSIIIIMIVLSLIGAGLLTFLSKSFAILPFLRTWILMFALVLAVLMIKIEFRHRQRVKTDKTGVFGSVTDITFYEEYLVMETTMAAGESKLDYKDFYGLIETRGYFIFYYSTSMATMLRKRDMKDTNVDMGEFKDFIVDKFAGKYRRL